MARLGLNVAGIVVCGFGVWLIYFFALGNTDGRLIDVPGYVKAFFLAVGGGIIGGGSTFFQMAKRKR